MPTSFFCVDDGLEPGWRSKLYSMPARCCASVKLTAKSALKSLPPDEAHENVHPMRRW